MTFQEALKKLDIEDYGSRIFNSNSHGELFHLAQYFSMAEKLKEIGGFREWFIATVAFAEKNMERPESIFQHIEELLIESIDYTNQKMK